MPLTLHLDLLAIATLGVLRYKGFQKQFPLQTHTFVQDRWSACGTESDLSRKEHSSGFFTWYLIQDLCMTDGLHVELNPTWSVLQDFCMVYSLDLIGLIA